jgi:hypothetical protein
MAVKVKILFLNVQLWLLRIGARLLSSVSHGEPCDGVQYDFELDTLTIEGARYARDMFRQTGCLLPLGKLFRLVSRKEGVIELESVGPGDHSKVPHCDSRVLHAPGECRYCDGFPEWQQARRVWGINFTGHHDKGFRKCPSESSRGLKTIEQWPGNRAEPPAVA